MPYSEFTISTIKQKLDLHIDESRKLFDSVESTEISNYLRETLEENVSLALAISTEKARSELIIAPILVELRKLLNRQISLFSGVDFSVDETRGLVGICDFIITRSTEQLAITTPVIMLVEAKNEDMKRGYGQCIAEMVAAQEFNLKEGNSVSEIYGVVTTGNNWRFLKLVGKVAHIDLSEYHISQINKIIAILIHLVK